MGERPGAEYRNLAPLARGRGSSAGVLARAKDSVKLMALQSTFHVTLYHDIWRVTLDGVFFGSYRSKANAIESIGERQRTLEAAGRRVKIVTPNGAG